MITENTTKQKKIVDYAVKFDDSTLHIGVDNLGELKELLKNVDDKQKELQEAVRNLSRFKLKINFLQTQPTHLPSDHTE